MLTSQKQAKRKSRPPELTIRHWVITAGGILTCLSAVALMASTQMESVSRAGYVKQGDRFVGVRVAEYTVPNRNRDLYFWLGALAGGLVICLPGIRMGKQGPTVINPDTLGSDIVETATVWSKNLLYWTGNALGGAINWSRVTGKNTVIPLVLRASPPVFQDLYDKLASIDWFKEYLAEDRHYWIISETGGGKTTLLRRLLYEVLVGAANGTYKNVKILIFDINYGAPDKDGKINDWFGLPRSQYIKVNSDEILEATEGLYQEFCQRRDDYIALATAVSEGKSPATIAALRAKCDSYGFFFFIVEEWVALRSDLGEAWIDKMTTILVQCRKYGMKGVVVSQMIYEKNTKIGLGLRLQFAKILLGKTAEDPMQAKEVLKGGLNVDEEVGRLIAIRRRHKYACFVQYGNHPGAVPRVIPDLSDMERVRIVGPWMTVEQQWWQEIYLANPGNRQWLEEQVVLHLQGKGPSLMSSSNPALKERFGVKANGRDKKYTDYLKPTILDIQERYKRSQATAPVTTTIDV